MKMLGKLSASNHTSSNMYLFMTYIFSYKFIQFHKLINKLHEKTFPCNIVTWSNFTYTNKNNTK